MDRLRISPCDWWTTAKVSTSPFLIIHFYRDIINSNSRQRASEIRLLSTICPPRPGGYSQISLDILHRYLDSRLPRAFNASITLLILKALSQLFELLSERQLFDQDDAENYSKELHLQHIVECMGQFPLEFLQACEDRKKYFDKEGERYPANYDDLSY